MSTIEIMTEKNTERRVRRALARRDLRLAKGRPGQYVYGGYMVLDAESRAVVGGGKPVAYGLSLEQAAEYVHWYRSA